MQLYPAVDPARLKFKPHLNPAEKCRFKALTLAYKFLRETRCDAALAVRDQALQILRFRYTVEYDAMNRHQRLDEKEWDAVQEYFPARYHRTYFSSSMFGRPVNDYLRLAERVFENVSVRGRGRDTDFIIVGTEPGRKTPSLLARMHMPGAAAPNLYEIKQIISMKRTQWQSSKPCIIGLVIGAIAGMYLQHALGSDIGGAKDSFVIPGCTLLGMLAGLGLMYCVNRFKQRALTRSLPHLSVA